MGYSKISHSNAEERVRREDEPAVRALGYELRHRGDPRPREIRFNYFHYEEGNIIRRHCQQEQEELFFVVDGRVSIEVDGEEFTAETGDFVVVDSGSWRRTRALTETEIFAIGAPNVADDHVFEEPPDQ